MSWDFDFGEEETFQNFFTETDTTTFSFSSGDSFFQPQQPVVDVEQPIIHQSLVSPPESPLQTQDQASQALIEENNQLRDFFNSLKVKAEQVQQQNTTLKQQLNDCRTWFKQAMFSGIHNNKK